MPGLKHECMLNPRITIYFNSPPRGIALHYFIKSPPTFPEHVHIAQYSTLESLPVTYLPPRSKIGPAKTDAHVRHLIIHSDVLLIRISILHILHLDPWNTHVHSLRLWLRNPTSNPTIYSLHRVYSRYGFGDQRFESIQIVSEQVGSRIRDGF